MKTLKSIERYVLLVFIGLIGGIGGSVDQFNEDK